MRPRVRKKRPAPAPSGRPDEVRIEVVGVEGPGRLLTLEDPGAAPGAAAGAFCRLRPPADTPGDLVASWRESVAKVALAVRVVSAPTSAAVPLDAARPDERPVGSFREEALRLADDARDPDVSLFVRAVLDEAGA